MPYKYRELPSLETAVISAEESDEEKFGKTLQTLGQAIGTYEATKAKYEEWKKLTDRDLARNAYNQAKEIFDRKGTPYNEEDLVKTGKTIFNELKFRHQTKLSETEKILKETEGPRTRWEQIQNKAGELGSETLDAGLKGARAVAGSKVGSTAIDVGKVALSIPTAIGRGIQGIKAEELQQRKGVGYAPISREELAAMEANEQEAPSPLADLAIKAGEIAASPFTLFPGGEELKQAILPGRKKFRVGGQSKQEASVLESIRGIPGLLKTGVKAAVEGISTEEQMSSKFEDLSKFYSNESIRLAQEEFGPGASEEAIAGRAKQIYSTLVKSDEYSFGLDHPQLSQLGYELVGDVLPVSLPGAAIKAVKLGAGAVVKGAEKVAPKATATAIEGITKAAGKAKQAGYAVFSRDAALADLDDLGELGDQIGSVIRAAKDSGQVEA